MRLASSLAGTTVRWPPQDRSWRSPVSGGGCVARGRSLSIVTNGRGLTATQRASLKRDGYLLVPSLLDQRVLVRIRHRLDELVRQTIAAWQAGRVADIAEPGVVRVQLDLADASFTACREHPLLADAAATWLGPGWHLAALNLRRPLPRCGHPGRHA